MVTENTDFRALCAELLADYEEHLYRSVLADRARAALAAEPVAERPTTADLRQVFDDQSGYIDDEQVMWAGDFYKAVRAVLARWGHQPAPPAEGEVGELAVFLRDCAEDHYGQGRRQFTRAADLLEQRHPAPVPMSERLPGPGDCDAGRCYWGRQDSGRQQWNWTFSTIPMGDTHWLPAFVQSLPTIVLPLPQGEVEP